MGKKHQFDGEYGDKQGLREIRLGFFLERTIFKQNHVPWKKFDCTLGFLCIFYKEQW